MKKGFTLIELLAVIVILAIIAVIAVPIVIDIIENTKTNSVKSSANMYLKAAELYISNAQLNKVKIEPGTYSIMEDGNICIGIIEESSCNGEVIKIDVKGNKPNSGKIIIDEKSVKIDYLEISGYIYYKNNDEYIVEKGKKQSVESTDGIITLDSSTVPYLTNYRIYGNTLYEILPEEYQQVEYIASDGTQYIDTGIIPNQDTGFDIIFETFNNFGTTGYGAIFGARTSSTINEFQLSTYSDNSSFKGTFRFGSGVGYSAGIKLNQINHITLKNKIYTNNDDVKFVLNKDFTSTSNLIIFGLNDGGNIVQSGKTLLYSLKLYIGETLIRDFIPCYRKSDGKVGLYDVVTNNFYESKNSKGAEQLIKGKNYYFDNIDSFTVGTHKIINLGNLVSDETHDKNGKYEIIVKVLGKNLISPQHIYQKETGYREMKYDNRDCIRFVDNADNFYEDFYFLKNTQYTISFDSKVVSSSTSNSGASLLFSYYYYDGTKVDIIRPKNSEWDKSILTSEKNKTISKIGTRSYNFTNYVYIDVDTFQIEKGTAATEYEPYKEEKYSIYLDEPLRCVGNICDYIDFESGKVVRYIEENYNILNEPKLENIDLPKIKINKGVSNIFIETKIKPSKFIVE